jgi:hypothetical protein
MSFDIRAINIALDKYDGKIDLLIRAIALINSNLEDIKERGYRDSTLNIKMDQLVQLNGLIVSHLSDIKHKEYGNDNYDLNSKMDKLIEEIANTNSHLRDLKNEDNHDYDFREIVNKLGGIREDIGKIKSNSSNLEYGVFIFISFICFDFIAKRFF